VFTELVEEEVRFPVMGKVKAVLLGKAIDG
jgi:hypothetical protein